MPRIKLAHWHDGRPPGAELDVDDVQLAALKRDGRVAEVLDTASPDAAVGDGPPAAPEEQAAAEEPEPVPEPATPQRKRR